MTTETPFLSSDASLEAFALCCNCANEFQKTRSWSAFCSKECRMEFANRMKKQGGPLAPLVKAWTATRHTKPGTEEAEICAWSRQQITEIARMFLDEEEQEGHGSAVDYVRGLMKSGFLYVDRRR